MRSFAMALVLAAGVSILAAVPAQAQTPAAAPAAAATNQRLFNGDAGITLLYVKPDKTADFETAMGRVKEALMKSEKPERKAQASSMKLFKMSVASPTSQVYVLVANPSVKNADYQVGTILTDGLPQEARAIYDMYFGALTTQPATVIPLDLVNDFSK